ncbi:hypothetical protein FXF53_03675 [Micromonospora sp. WP24]|nr:hypothetical protein FXF53_03675 [Micromonospora sp. WP24]
MPRVSYEQYVVAVAFTLARRHWPVWSWERWRTVCRCGSELPCRKRPRIPIDRDHWPLDPARQSATPVDWPAARETPR